MANNIYIPELNPVPFVPLNKEPLPQYLSRNMDDFWFSEQQSFYNTPVKYFQKWLQADAIKFQFTSNFSSIQLQLIDCDQNIIITQVAVKKRVNKYIVGYYLYEATISLAPVPNGVYFILMTLAGTKTMISEPMQVGFDGETMLFEYDNSRFHGDMIFETGLSLSFRVEAKLSDFEPGNERIAYRDQRLNPTVLSSIPFRTWNLIIGKDYGVPDWVAHKLNWIFSCDNVRIDGKSYAVNEDSTLEAVEIDSVYPLRPYNLRVQEGYNRASKIIGVEVDPNKKILMGIAVDSTIFGDISDDAGSNIINITSLE